MNKIMKIFIYFHTFLLFKYLEKYWDKYPIEKKNKKKAAADPIPKKYFSRIKKILEKLPKKNTVYE